VAPRRRKEEKMVPRERGSFTGWLSFMGIGCSCMG
jgi:hypothetical protein